MTSSTFASLTLALGVASMVACSHSTSNAGTGNPSPAKSKSTTPPNPDPRVGLRAGKMDAGEAVWNLRVVSKTPPSDQFVGVTNSDLAFNGHYAIQGNYNGWQIWDISNPSKPSLADAYVCPASQSDVSTYKNLLFVSGENLSARLDCGTEGVEDSVSTDRLRGIRIFDISDIAHPRNVGNVQTCRGSHTHSLLVDPKDPANVYVYISGSSPVRSSKELAGCVAAMPTKDPNSAWFRIEVIKIPLAHPEQAAIVSSPRIFDNLVAPPKHGETPADSIEDAKKVAEAKANGGFVISFHGHEQVLNPHFAEALLDSTVKARGGSGAPTAADSAALRQSLPALVASFVGTTQPDSGSGPTQCHDITLYPGIGLGGGACEGYGLLLDISDPAHPKRLAAASDSNFSYWHSATFNNSGSKILFSDEWGGGSQPKCRKTDPRDWGADAIFTIPNRQQLQFQSYYKLPAPQTAQENCVAHNGSLIPIPGRDIMVQAWYQGGLSVFEWTDAKHPKEIAFFDRGPVDAVEMGNGGYWSTYWYNGHIYGSEISRGLDVFELQPSGFLTQNEIDAAKSVKLDYFNTQGQVKFTWPATYSLARAYLDQLERSQGMDAARIADARAQLAKAEKAAGANEQQMLTQLVSRLESEANGAGDASKVRLLVGAVKQLATSPSLATK
jgi:LVIVD repeat-containing protein